jgi:inhibitor of KinA sporulation pathway (predicted exonuclease)
MNYIIFDLEATCWETRGSGQRNEIIEIGALKFNEVGEKIDEFCAFVYPKLNPILSPFCKQLTHIKQSDIDSALPFPEVLSGFQEWIGEDYLLCSWGLYDRNQLKADCKLHELPGTWAERHISLKHQHPEVRGIGKRMGMARALELEGFQLEGTHHRGIDDARNISKIFLKYLGQWKLPL